VNACAAVEQGREYALERRCATEALTGSNGPGRDDDDDDDDPPGVVVIPPDIVPLEVLLPIIMPATPVIPAEAGVPVPFFPWAVGVLTELALDPDLEVFASMVKELRTG
jgi:hypothetical protein